MKDIITYIVVGVIGFLAGIGVMYFINSRKPPVHTLTFDQSGNISIIGEGALPIEDLYESKKQDGTMVVQIFDTKLGEVIYSDTIKQTYFVSKVKTQEYIDYVSNRRNCRKHLFNVDVFGGYTDNYNGMVGIDVGMLKFWKFKFLHVGISNRGFTVTPLYINIWRNIDIGGGYNINKNEWFVSMGVELL